MIISKLQRCETVRVEQPDHWYDRAIRCITDARGNAMLVMHKALMDADLEPGDIITINVRIQVERNKR